MRYITVAEFRESAAENQIKSVVVHADSAAGEYALVVRLGWRDEDHLIVTHLTRKPRVWKSVDRLLEFLKAEGVSKPELVIKFNNE